MTSQMTVFFLFDDAALPLGQKTLKFEVLLLCLALSTKELETGRLGVRIMVWVGTSLLTRGVVFQWASTIKTALRSD